MSTSGLLRSRVEHTSTTLGHAMLGFGLFLAVWGTVTVHLTIPPGLTFFGRPWALLLAVLLLSTRLVAQLTRPRLTDVRFWMDAPMRCAVGEVVTHRLAVDGPDRGWSGPMDFTLSSLGFGDMRGSLPPIPPSRHVSLVAARRALWRAHVSTHVLTVTARDRFGLSTTTATYVFERHLVIEPQLVDVDLPRTRWHGGEDDGARADRMGVQPFAVRQWRPGDSRRNVHWRSTARRGELIVVERAVPHEPRLALLIIGDGLLPAPEQVVAHMASYGLEGLRAGMHVMLLGLQPGPPVVRRATRDDVMDWCTAIVSPALMHGPEFLSALRAAGPGARIAVWTSRGMTQEWWSYLDQVAAQHGVELYPAQEGNLVAA